MNAIDAHRDELERLLVNLLRDTAVSGMAFVALLDTYIRRLDTKSLDCQRKHRYGSGTDEWKIEMEPTLTQNCALYYAHHKTSKDRANLFKKLRAAAGNRRPDVRRQLTFGELFLAPRLHKDNGR
jgi:hypothetical protein